MAINSYGYNITINLSRDELKQILKAEIIGSSEKYDTYRPLEQVITGLADTAGL